MRCNLLMLITSPEKLALVKKHAASPPVASDRPLELDVPVLDLNNPATVADFIKGKFLK